MYLIRLRHPVNENNVKCNVIFMLAGLLAQKNSVTPKGWDLYDDIKIVNTEILNFKLHLSY